MKSIKIFLASSAELEIDRKAFEAFLYQKSKLWMEEKDVFLELKNWEDFIDAMSQTRLQDEYNKAIEDADLFVMLFWTRVGKYTDEEFETAVTQFNKNNKPLIYTYFKDAPHAGPKQSSLETFEEKLKSMGHFKTIYKNTEGLLLHFSSQLDKLYSLKIPNAQLKQSNKKLTKDQVLDLINKGDLFDVFEELNKYFLGKNDSLNALMSEYINQPNNFNQAQFVGRLKVFVSRNW